MGDNNKKISFSFSKTKKPSIAKVSNVEEKEKIEYISCFDKKKDAIKERNEKSKKSMLVIPMISSNTFNGISAKLEKKNEQNKNVKCSEDNKDNSNRNGHSQDNKTDKQMTADEIAAAEILSSIKNSNEDKKNCSDFVIAQTSKSELELSNESTIDYDQVPVSEFGFAMLRGMGWKENAGIGKEPRTVSTVSPKLRPKGLGLGAKYKPESDNQEIKKKKVSIVHCLLFF
ncbi:pre-mRNA-splicing factor SPP2, putative [Pediculus humanus corporis]|uniref:Pre-mRNA-splicing factor SPP2, putative n=1 Tax=Pediculus humanus subsp. corporis TaxID=121224 RepID=E0VCW5_PEDHC|nr:pre-mRNA-splicing factor SPP2, putative [Pediculus humanus corporis]EEB11221.1 pre-mRNA-splicing factor SPP2, putative [Pediculus humanus corporis]